MNFNVINLQPLGSGGFADVYVGVRTDNGEKVVVKVLREPHVPGAREAFMREFRILSRRLHRRIMAVLGARVDVERPYYIMPYMEGGSLTRLAGRLADRQLLDVAVQLAEAIEALHRANIVHGDIKPDNVLISGDEVRLGDPLGNGGGCTVSFSTKIGGTPGYWAPEVAAGQPISFASDVYSFGASLFHLATGYVSQDGVPVDPLRFRPDLQGSGILSAILAACRREPTQRPTIKQLRDYLLEQLRRNEQASSPSGVKRLQGFHVSQGRRAIQDYAPQVQPHAVQIRHPAAQPSATTARESDTLEALLKISGVGLVVYLLVKALNSK